LSQLDFVLGPAAFLPVVRPEPDAKIESLFFLMSS